jgi:hypothetical protein
VVIDESSTMASALPEVIRVLQRLPMACEFAAFVASDEVVVERDPKVLGGLVKLFKTDSFLSERPLFWVYSFTCDFLRRRILIAIH